MLGRTILIVASMVISVAAVPVVVERTPAPAVVPAPSSIDFRRAVKPKDARAVKPKDARAVKPKDARAVKPKDARAVKPKDARAVKPKDARAVKPKDP